MNSSKFPTSVGTVPFYAIEKMEKEIIETEFVKSWNKVIQSFSQQIELEDSLSKEESLKGRYKRPVRTKLLLELLEKLCLSYKKKIRVGDQLGAIIFSRSLKGRLREDQVRIRVNYNTLGEMEVESQLLSRNLRELKQVNLTEKELINLIRELLKRTID